MASSANIIVGKMYTPVDETGVRREVLFRTTTDLVYNPSTGKTIEDEMTNVAENINDATETSSGLASPSLVRNVNKLIKDQHIISASQPTISGYWFQIEDIETDEEG